MNQFPFRVDQKLTDVLQSKKFTLSAEVIPPRNGAEQIRILSQVERLVQSGSHFLAVTKGAGGSLRGGSLPIAQTIKESFNVPCIAHFTCRDLLPAEIENELMDHHYFGIRNILALRGDPPQDQPDWIAKPESYSYAYELIDQIRQLNQGKYLTRPGGREPKDPVQTDFCIGAAVYPEHPNPEERIEYFQKKVEAGAEYAITQMLFDVDAYDRFLEDCARNQMQIPILPGTRILTSRKQALRMAQRFEVSVPDSMIEGLPEEAGPDTLNQTVDLFMGFFEKLKSVGAPGIHLFVLSGTEEASLALSQLNQFQS